MMTLIFSDEYVGGGSTITDARCMASAILSTSQISSTGPTALAAAGFAVTFFSGSMPSNTAMNTFLVSQGTALLQFSGTASNITKGSLSKVITINFGSTFGTIISAGTIGWFSIGNTSTTLYNYPQFFGTVGLSGSGADLILPKVTVLTTDLWLCTNLTFNIGASHTHI